MDSHCKGEIHMNNFKTKGKYIKKTNNRNVMHNTTTLTNNQIIQSPIKCYSHFCNECENLSRTESALNNYELQYHPF